MMSALPDRPETPKIMNPTGGIIPSPEGSQTAKPPRMLREAFQPGNPQTLFELRVMKQKPVLILTNFQSR
jgi:hypothetical protein